MLSQAQAIIQANKESARRMATTLRRTENVSLTTSNARELIARSLGAASWSQFATTGPAN